MIHRIAPALMAFTCAAAFLFPVHPARAEEWQITYSVTQEQLLKDPQGTAAPKKQERSYILTITLGQQHLAADDGHEKRVYNFARRRMLQLNLDKHEYDDWSLYSNIGSRVREIQNRFAIGASWRATKFAAQEYFGRFDNETNLGIVLPEMKLDEPEPVIEREDLPGGGLDFRHDGLSVVQFIPATTALPVLFSPRFASFLAYECNIHPKIRRQLAVADGIPRLLVTHWRLGNQQNTATYRLKSVERLATDSTVVPANFRPAPHQEGPFKELFHVISLVRDPVYVKQRITRDGAGQFAKDVIAAKRPLDACLALIEYGLQSGEQNPDDLRQYKREFEQDNQCRLYLASLDQSSDEACRKSLASCESIDRTGLRKAYMLDLQRADLLQILGRGRGGATTPAEQNQTVTAETLFLKVLAANPFLAGAYHDLGALYDETFRSSLAWLCFDTGRQISPDHRLLKDITTLEQRFQHDFLDYF